MATVTNLTAVHRNGQTFLTFDEIAGVGVSYTVYRETTQITSLSGLSPVAALVQGSGAYLHDDSAAADLNSGFVIEDEGDHLASGTGLLVWTTAANGTFFYAVTNSTDATLSVGNNSLASGVAEVHQAVHGYVIIDITTGVSAHTQYRCFRWEDYSTWNQADWGYYGHRFNVHVPEAIWGIDPPYLLYVRLHAAGANGYAEPTPWASAGQGVIITCVDMAFTSGFTDPYTGAGYNYSKWFGRVDDDGFIKPCTESRVINYVELIRDDATFEIDSNRIYMTGASLGSGAMRIAAHNPGVFSAVAVSIGWINDDAWQSDDPDNKTIKVNDSSGPTWYDHQDMEYLAGQGVFCPIIHTFSKNDGTIIPTDYPAALQEFEATAQPFAARWHNDGHAESYLTGAWDFLRFLKNEAYPCFADASNSDAFSATEGQRNVNLDWHSSLHTISGGSAITDTADEFSISLLSLDDPATADITIRNQQSFTPSGNVDWDDGTNTGTVSVNGDGSITVPGVTIGDTATRLMLTEAESPARAFGSIFGGVIR